MAQLLCKTMPKVGPSPLEWKKRLEAFARGEYSFSTGQKSRKGSRWYKDVCAIEACPRRGKPAAGADPAFYEKTGLRSS